jgi:hypothetical protein
MDDAPNDMLTTTTRRTFVKGVVAAGTGVAAAAYVKPSLRALGVPGALAQVSGEPITPTDSSTTGSSAPSNSSRSNPLLPSTGAGGMSDTSGESSSSVVPQMLGVAIAGGLFGRRALRALREDHEAMTGGAARDA